VASTSTAANGSNEPVTPQLGESFIDRLVDVLNNKVDLKYRQEQVKDIRRAALDVIPYETETSYYESLLAQMQSLPSRTNADPAVSAEIARTQAGLVEAFGSVENIYDSISKNLNGSTALYTLSGPVMTQTDRGLSLGRALAYALALILLAIPMLLVGCWIHHRLQEEDESLEEEEAVERALP
jgi:hypothetical protein